MERAKQTKRKSEKIERVLEKSKLKARRRALSKRNYTLLWGLSGGFCAYCQKPFIDMKTLEVAVHQAHVIARDDKNLPSYRDIPYELKDRYENLFLLHPTCHEKTKNFPLEELELIKTNHEKHVRNTLNGIYDPYPFGNGKYLTYPHIIYNQVEKPFNTFYGYLNIFLFGGSIVSFIPLFIFLTKPEDYIMAGAFFLGLTIFCAVALFKAIKHFKNKPTHIEHEANCIFSGCNGKVAIRRQNFLDSLNKKNLPDTGIGICSFDPTHTFTVPLDLSLSNRGDYHPYVVR